MLKPLELAEIKKTTTMRIRIRRLILRWSHQIQLQNRKPLLNQDLKLEEIFQNQNVNLKQIKIKVLKVTNL